MRDVMREEFEAAYDKQYGRKPQNWDEKIYAYRDAHANGAYWAWRTATPTAFGNGYRAGFRAATGETEQ